jgi:hypothetical protein
MEICDKSDAQEFIFLPGGQLKLKQSPPDKPDQCIYSSNVGAIYYDCSYEQDGRPDDATVWAYGGHFLIPALIHDAEVVTDQMKSLNALDGLQPVYGPDCVDYITNYTLDILHIRPTVAYSPQLQNWMNGTGPCQYGPHSCMAAHTVANATHQFIRSLNYTTQAAVKLPVAIGKLLQHHLGDSVFGRKFVSTVTLAYILVIAGGASAALVLTKDRKGVKHYPLLRAQANMSAVTLIILTILSVSVVVFHLDSMSEPILEKSRGPDFANSDWTLRWAATDDCLTCLDGCGHGSKIGSQSCSKDADSQQFLLTSDMQTIILKSNPELCLTETKSGLELQKCSDSLSSSQHFIQKPGTGSLTLQSGDGKDSRCIGKDNKGHVGLELCEGISTQVFIYCKGNPAVLAMLPQLKKVAAAVQQAYNDSLLQFTQKYVGRVLAVGIYLPTLLLLLTTCCGPNRCSRTPARKYESSKKDSING